MEREVNQINVIPLVDVMLVLLVIVLTTATFISTGQIPVNLAKAKEAGDCLLYTSDAADERSSVDLGGRRIIKKKNHEDI